MANDSKIRILVDGKQIEAEKGKTVLQACLDNNIYIPNLCYLEEMTNPPVSCRMCFVEIEGEKKPIPSCSMIVKEGLVVKTDTPEVRRLQRAGLRLLLSVHDVDCGECPANKKCELQRSAKLLKVGLKPKALEQCLKEPEIDETHPFLNYYPNRCVLCGKCIYVSKKLEDKPFLTFAKRGFDTVISFYGADLLSESFSEVHRACVEICPVGALTLKGRATSGPME